MVSIVIRIQVKERYKDSGSHKLSGFKYMFKYSVFKYLWAVTCDFQQCGILTTVESDSDEPVQPPLRLRNSIWCSVSSLNSHRILKQLAKALIRLHIYTGWSEALLVPHTTLLELSCRSSYWESAIIGQLMRYFKVILLRYIHIYQVELGAWILALAIIDVPTLWVLAAKAHWQDWVCTNSSGPLLVINGISTINLYRAT